MTSLPQGDALAAPVVSAGAYDEILSTAESSFCILDPLTGKTLYASPNTVDVLGVSPEALVGCAAHAVALCSTCYSDARSQRLHVQAKRAFGGDTPGIDKSPGGDDTRRARCAAGRCARHRDGPSGLRSR